MVYRAQSGSNKDLLDFNVDSGFMFVVFFLFVPSLHPPLENAGISSTDVSTAEDTP